MLHLDTYFRRFGTAKPTQGATMTDKLFSSKIKYLYKQLNMTEREFTKLFCKGKGDEKTIKKEFASRYKTVKEKWLKGVTQSTKGFYFDEYPISKYTIENDTPAFTYESFTVDSVEAFKERVDRYIAYKAKPKRGFEYRYIYSYDVQLKKVVYHQLRIIKEITNDSYEIEMIPHKLFRDIGVESSIGTLTIEREYIYVSVQNNFRIINIYFVLNRGYVNNNKMNGVSLGISYNSGLPNGRKALLTKNLLSSEEEGEFYLNVNETNFIEADNILNDIYSDTKTQYRQSLSKKLNNLTEYIQKSQEILKDEIKDDIYTNLLHAHLIRNNNVATQIINQQSFNTYTRQEALEIFLNSVSHRKNGICNIVYPILTNSGLLMDSNDRTHIEFYNFHKQMIDHGLTINRIFILENSIEITDYFKQNMKLLIEYGVNVKIALSHQTKELKLNSWDFIVENNK